MEEIADRWKRRNWVRPIWGKGSSKFVMANTTLFGKRERDRERVNSKDGDTIQLNKNLDSSSMTQKNNIPHLQNKET